MMPAFPAASYLDGGVVITSTFRDVYKRQEHIYTGLVLQYLLIDSQEQLWIGLSTGLYCCRFGEVPQLIDSESHVTYITELPQGIAIGSTWSV